tara:strand:- start:179 stop:508 length:330 start_codon:yes stop_codon:yes gene_type:complete
MANTFKNSISASIGTTETTVYTATGVTATVIGVSIANRIQSNINVDVKMYDSSTSKNIVLCSGSLIPPGSNIVLVGGEQKVVLEASDSLTLRSNTAGSADIVISVLEIS